jgi:hypothetical protein
MSEFERVMAMSGSRSATEFAVHLNSFRPSNQDALSEAFGSVEGEKQFVDAVRQYVNVWADSDHVEAYTIARIGKWIGRHAPRPVIDELRAWSTGPVQREGDKTARTALFNGIQAGIAKHN